VAIGVLGLALLALGVVYLSVACQSLPGFMGPVHGDTSPRTGLGIIAAALGVVALGAAFAVSRRQAPPS
jgi:MYXO-CTERM domain-containing protein